MVFNFSGNSPQNKIEFIEYNKNFFIESGDKPPLKNLLTFLFSALKYNEDEIKILNKKISAEDHVIFYQKDIYNFSDITAFLSGKIVLQTINVNLAPGKRYFLFVCEKPHETFLKLKDLPKKEFDEFKKQSLENHHTHQLNPDYYIAKEELLIEQFPKKNSFENLSMEEKRKVGFYIDLKQGNYKSHGNIIFTYDSDQVNAYYKKWLPKDEQPKKYLNDYEKNSYFLQLIAEKYYQDPKKKPISLMILLKHDSGLTDDQLLRIKTLNQKKNEYDSTVESDTFSSKNKLLNFIKEKYIQRDPEIKRNVEQSLLLSPQIKNTLLNPKEENEDNEDIEID